MSLEQAGGSGLNKLIKTIKERYPNHNFDIPPEPDTKCKAPALCKTNTIFYTDTEGNRYCATRYKEVDSKNIHKWEFKTCHALVEQADQGGNQDVIPF